MQMFDSGGRAVTAFHTDPLAPGPATSPRSALTLSVLVPVYNERHLVAASLGRLLAVSDPCIREMEVVVVDDCSRDGSWEVLQQIAARDRRVRLFRHERNSGKGA